MRSKNRMTKICFCLLLSLSLIVCGLSIAYADTQDMTNGVLQNNANAASGEGTGTSANISMGTGTALDESIGAQGGENAGASTGEGADNGAVSATGEGADTENAESTGAQGENAGASAGDKENANNSSTEGKDTGTVADESAEPSSSEGENAGFAPNANLLGASPVIDEGTNSTTIDIEVPTSLSFKNSGKNPTVLQEQTLVIKNNGIEDVTLSGISLTTTGYEMVSRESSTDFSDTADKKLSMSIQYDNAAYDLSNATSIPSITLSAGESITFTLSGNISAVNEKTSASFATLTFTISAEGTVAAANISSTSTVASIAGSEDEAEAGNTTAAEYSTAAEPAA